MLYINDLEIELNHSYQIKTKGKKKFETHLERIGGLKIESYGVSLDKVGDLVEAIQDCFEHDPIEAIIKMKSQNL